MRWRTMIAGWTVHTTLWLVVARQIEASTLLAELRLALLDGGHDHVANGTRGETVQVTLSDKKKKVF